MKKYLPVPPLLVLILVAFAGCSTPRTPKGVYDAAWKETQKRIYDPSVLGKWEQWRHRFDDKIKTDEDVEKYADEMLATSNDPYCDLISVKEQELDKMHESGKFAGVGISWLAQYVDGKKVRNAQRETMPETTTDGFCIIEIMTGGPAQKAGIKSGDAIVNVEGKSTRGRSIANIASSMRGVAGQTVTLSYRRGADTKSVTLTRTAFVRESVTSKLLNGNIGYICLPSFSLDHADDMIRAELIKLTSAESLILDLRDNGGGYVHHALSILGMLVDEGVLVIRHQREPSSADHPKYSNLTHRLTRHSLWDETTTDGRVIKTVKGRERYLLNGRALVVLVNGDSASASELVSGSLRDNGVATLIGTTTFGKGIGQQTFDIGRGMQLKLTTFRYYTPSGYWPGNGDDELGPGITPNIVVKPNVRFFEKGSPEDNQLQAAVEQLKTKKGGK